MAVSAHYDETAARLLERQYDSAEARAQRSAVLAALSPQPGERVLDLGAGPGFLAAEIAAAVGPDGQVVAADTSEPMLELARRRCAGLRQVELRTADATALPFADGAFDAAAIVQVYEYVGEIGSALGELRRVLRGGGRAVIVDTDWDSLVWASGDAARMRRVLAAFNAKRADAHLPRRLGGLLRAAGLVPVSVSVHPLLEADFAAGSFSDGLIDSICRQVTARAGVPEAEAAQWAADLRGRDAAGGYFFSLNRYLFLARRP